jgi:hypothetical protein
MTETDKTMQSLLPFNSTRMNADAERRQRHRVSCLNVRQYQQQKSNLLGRDTQ